jgi:hypothetical protein
MDLADDGFFAERAEEDDDPEGRMLLESGVEMKADME